MILKQLRDETSRNHADIESHMPLLEPTLRLNTYRDLMWRYWEYYAPLETRLQQEIEAYWPKCEYVWSERHKTPLLELDLQSLGPTRETNGTSLVLPELTTPAQVLGCLYVLEGATLGGQIISKQLNMSLGLTSSSGAAFFHGYGSETCAKWHSFRQFLTNAAEPLHEDDEIVVSANETFRTLTEWLFPFGKRATLTEPEALSDRHQTAEPETLADRAQNSLRVFKLQESASGSGSAYSASVSGSQ